MQKLKQTIVKRKSHTTDEGTMGFHDYVEKRLSFFCFGDGKFFHGNLLYREKNFAIF